ncbi:MAG: hypothetical protein KatS3mg003_1341 [Candidatus Nitrosocaldaceae archaeon]|nr:MAG: hypothetical protein KatS3mg003_1341 [Candidatus Nitrosocaldaceae archaeon]
MQQIRVIIRLALKKELADAIVKALMPDNINFPEGLSMDIDNDEKLKIIFTCDDPDKISSMINITDEVLEHISIILNTIGDTDVRS